MRYTNKWGDELEVTPEEYVKLKKLERLEEGEEPVLDERPTPTTTVPKQVVKKVVVVRNNKRPKNDNLIWKHDEISYLRENYGRLKTRTIMRELGRTRKAVWSKAQELGLKKYGQRFEPSTTKEAPKEAPKKEVVVDKKQGPGTYERTSEHKDYLRRRMKFMAERANQLMRTNNWPRGKAMAQASDEWKQQQGLPPKKGHYQGANNRQRKVTGTFTTADWPDIYPLDHEANKRLIPVIHHIVSNKGALKMFELTSIAASNLAEGVVWGGRAWHEFLEQFLLNSDKVASYFNVKNKFRVERDEHDYEVLTYR